MKTTLLLLSLECLILAAARGADDAAPDAPARHTAVVNRLYEADVKAATGNADVLVLPGLRADRKDKRVRVLAETTDIKVGDTVEFVLIGQNSGHDYESLAVSFARPSDVHRAIEFIGLKPGRGADATRLQFRPKGERVLVSFRAFGADSSVAAVRAEDMMTDTEAQKTVPRSGYVFIGSALKAENGATGSVYAADTFEPCAVIANYNESESVLDVPREAPQQEVYSRQVVSAGFAFGTNALTEVLMEPEYKDGRIRCLDCTMDVTPPQGEAKEAAVTVRDEAGKAVNDVPTLKTAIGALMARVRDGHTPFVTLRFDDALTLRAVRQVCAAMNDIDVDDGICVDAPQPGNLYYRAFMPNEKFRDRAGRISQPWELKLTVREGRAEGVLTRIEQIWRDNEIMPELSVQDIPVGSPEGLRQELSRRGPGLPVILTFAPAEMTYGQAMAFIRPVLDTHPTVHIFVEEPTPSP